MSETVHIEIGEDVDRNELFGGMDSNMGLVQESTGAEIIQRGNELLVKGPDEEAAERARKIVQELISMVARGEKLDSQKVNYVIRLQEEGVSYSEKHVSGDIIAFTTKGRPVRPKTLGQEAYVKCMREQEVVFAIGPAGTGKTYLAVAMAVSALKDKKIQKIVLARPAVEAGENLGFLPGDLQEKVDPYLRPLYDALFDLLGKERAELLREKDVIEVVPLAYMRGRTLDDAFIILDEAQNATREQMKMFLTRMGFGSRIVVTGDVTQIDLPSGRKSGLIEAERVLRHVKGISFCRLNDVDVVRNEMVRRIIQAYDHFEQKKEPERG